MFLKGEETMELNLMDAVRAWTAADELKKRAVRYDFALALVKVKKEISKN